MTASRMVRLGSAREAPGAGHEPAVAGRAAVGCGGREATHCDAHSAWQRAADPAREPPPAAAAHPPLLAAAGFTAAKLFGQGVSYTYDDVIFLPGHINFGAHEVRRRGWRRRMLRRRCTEERQPSALQQLGASWAAGGRAPCAEGAGRVMP